jgi:hypothetical protein
LRLQNVFHRIRNKPCTLSNENSYIRKPFPTVEDQLTIEAFIVDLEVKQPDRNVRFLFVRSIHQILAKLQERVGNK